MPWIQKWWCQRSSSRADWFHPAGARGRSGAHTRAARGGAQTCPARGSTSLRRCARHQPRPQALQTPTWAAAPCTAPCLRRCLPESSWPLPASRLPATARRGPASCQSPSAWPGPDHVLNRQCSRDAQRRNGSHCAKSPTGTDRAHLQHCAAASGVPPQVF